MDPQTIPAEVSSEANGDKRPANKIGLYKHEKSGAELVATTEPQADAYVRVGYEWVRDLQESDFVHTTLGIADPLKQAQADAILADARLKAAQLTAEAAKVETEGQQEANRAANEAREKKTKK